MGRKSSFLSPAQPPYVPFTGVERAVLFKADYTYQQPVGVLKIMIFTSADYLSNPNVHITMNFTRRPTHRSLSLTFLPNLI